MSAGTPDRDRRTSPTPNLSFVHNFPSFVLSLFDVRRPGGFFVLFHQKNQPAAGHFLLFRSIPPKKSACGGLFPPFSFYSTKNRLRRAIFLFSFYSSVDVSFFRAIRSFWVGSTFDGCDRGYLPTLPLVLIFVILCCVMLNGENTFIFDYRS